MDSRPLSRRNLLAAALGASASPAMASGAPIDVSDPLGVRSHFPITSTKEVFLNTAYSAPIPHPVIAAAQAASEQKALSPIKADNEYKQDVRERFARLINADTDEIALIRSTGEGENLVAWGLGLKPGDNVVVSSLHYDTEFILYRVIEKELGVQFRIVPHRDGVVSVKEMEPFIDNRTKLISVAVVSHQNGYVHDLKAIADLGHSVGAYLFADAVQAAGVVPIDVKASGVGQRRITLPGYGVLNLNAMLMGDKCTISLFLKNVANERGLLSSANIASAIADPPKPADLSTVAIVQPRTVGLSMSAKF